MNRSKQKDGQANVEPFVDCRRTNARPSNGNVRTRAGTHWNILKSQMALGERKTKNPTDTFVPLYANRSVSNEPAM